ncbi:MAG TPA: nucleoside triphosphate pyrophosphohydrolase [Bacillota bacterium]|jgi:tetrapyrrole methylase family protein/MazG family protein|nr:nucleoside triphosphate pyrophosphohydrolase [Bacillota bacterium]HOL10125.1 nucleoside triphosphate pyrophosphohydrolase [Bacillota bacterium]HPO97879.1 nucleoside triphosphate pyrophosphohydrolase [Bacillota bacterium]
MSQNNNEAIFNRLVEIMHELRSEHGCPWDREQTHQSLKQYAIEETYEVLEAIDSGNMDKLKEELGDLLLQVVFHAEIATENRQFTIYEVIDTVCEKLIRRHPHVFAEVKVDGVDGVLDNWEKIKKEEHKEERNSVLDGVPIGLPALQKAEKYQRKAARVGFDWNDIAEPLEKVKEEFQEFEAVLNSRQLPVKGSPEWLKLEEEFGDILFSLVNVGRFLDINAEIALGQTINKFVNRFTYIEQEAAKLGKKLPEMTLAEMDRLWEQAKRNR